METIPLSSGPGDLHITACVTNDPRAVSAVGFRAVPLKNNYSENLELASLLVKIDIFPSKVRHEKVGEQRQRALPGAARCPALQQSGQRVRQGPAWAAFDLPKLKEADLLHPRSCPHSGESTAQSHGAQGCLGCGDKQRAGLPQSSFSFFYFFIKMVLVGTTDGCSRVSSCMWQTLSTPDPLCGSSQCSQPPAPGLPLL